MMNVAERIQSICPVCFQKGKIRKIDAEIVEEDGQVWMQKVCPTHGSFKNAYFGDVESYKKWMSYKVSGEPVPEVKTALFHDPPLYKEHCSQPMLTNLVVTNRGDPGDPYCYLDAKTAGYVYEPSLDQLRELMEQTRTEKPVGSDSLQILGGEPTLRDDLFDIIRCARDIGFRHIQIQTNGVCLAENIEYCRRLKSENVSSIYLNFSGITPETNPLLESNIKAIENLGKVNIDVVLTPVLIGGFNNHEVGKIIRFAFDHIDCIRGVHFQPVLSCGSAASLSEDERKKKQVTYSQIMDCIEQEFNGTVSKKDFYPISFVYPIYKFIEVVTREPQIKFTAHPGCGGSTILFMDKGTIIPLTRFVDAEADMKFLTKQAQKKGPLRKLRIATAFIQNINTFVNYDKAPEGFNSKQVLKDAAILGSQYATRCFRQKTLFVGFMGYQDPWDFSVDRLQQCVIHCPTFEGIIPWCSYVGLGYGEKIHKKYAAPKH
jgi:7,8-dihydro-6-hydroxymethylpterin dimethyltransferase